MNDGTPFEIGSLSSAAAAGIGDSPTKPAPCQLFRASASNTERNEILGMQVAWSLLKHPVSSDGLPVI